MTLLQKYNIQHLWQVTIFKAKSPLLNTNFSQHSSRDAALHHHNSIYVDQKFALILIGMLSFVLVQSRKTKGK